MVLAEKLFSNPLGALSSSLIDVMASPLEWAVLGTINWFQGDASAFYGIQYHIAKRSHSQLNTTDTMSRELLPGGETSVELRGVV